MHARTAVATRPRPLALVAGVLLALVAALALATAPARATDQLPVTGVSTALALDPGAAAALTSLGIRVSPATAATVDQKGRVVFPITGGSINPKLQGTIHHVGGLTLKKGFVAVGVQRFAIDTTGDPKLTAELRGLGIRFDLAKLAITNVSPGPGGSTVVTADVNLTAFAANVLNFAFGTKALTPGLKLGVAQSTVTLGAAS
jgi:hypothetical protein